MTGDGPRLASRSAPALTWRDSRARRRWWRLGLRRGRALLRESIPIHTTTIRPTKRTDPPDKRLEEVQKTLAELSPADYILYYTDWSATDKVENGGAGAVIYRGEAELRRIRITAGRWTSSYRA